MNGLVIDSRIRIAESELEERFIRASGPGGQNVNKLASAVQLRFDVLHSLCLPDAVRVRLMRLAGHRLTRDGVIVILAQRFREQERNRADARGRLAELIARAALPPRPREATRVPRSSRQKRIEVKKHRSKLKQSRASRFDD